MSGLENMTLGMIKALITFIWKHSGSFSNFHLETIKKFT